MSTAKETWKVAEHPPVSFEGDRYYFRSREGYYSTLSGKRLHVAIWERANGPVPHGHIVHHLDGDRLNNQIENLMPMTRADHARHHNSIHDQYTGSMTAGMRCYFRHKEARAEYQKRYLSDPEVRRKRNKKRRERERRQTNVQTVEKS